MHLYLNISERLNSKTLPVWKNSRLLLENCPALLLFVVCQCGGVGLKRTEVQLLLKGF